MHYYTYFFVAVEKHDFIFFLRINQLYRPASRPAHTVLSVCVLCCHPCPLPQSNTHSLSQLSHFTVITTWLKDVSGCRKTQTADQSPWSTTCSDRILFILLSLRSICCSIAAPRRAERAALCSRQLRIWRRTLLLARPGSRRGPPGLRENEEKQS